MHRPAVLITTLALLGLVAAAGIGLLVNEVSGDSIGLAAEPLSPTPLAPPEASEDAAERRRERAEELRDRVRDQVDRARDRLEELRDRQQEQVAPPPIDDDTFDEDNSGSGSENSGSGSDDSGSDDSGSDEFEVEDD
jgi:hypothetical protein